MSDSATADCKKQNRQEVAAMLRKYADLVESGDFQAVCISAVRGPDQLGAETTTAYWFEHGYFAALIGVTDISKNQMQQTFQKA